MILKGSKRKVRAYYTFIKEFMGDYNTNYQPFIVLAHPRTGSNLLASLLGSSHEVVQEYEIFNDEYRTVGMGYEQIMAELLRPYSAMIKAVGCKILYNQLTGEEWEKFLAYPDFRIIHLTRRNRLRTATSHNIATKTGQWSEYGLADKPPLEERKIWLDKDEVFNSFVKLNIAEQRARQRFKDREIFEVTYEELVSDTEGTVAAIARFIGVQPWEIKDITLRQQNPERLRDLIQNFDELKRAFSNTPWRAYFDEELY